MPTGGSVKLWRVDADYVTGDGDTVGQLSYFSLSPTWDSRSDVLIGWNRDFYQEEVDITREKAAELVGRPWPVLPIAELVALASGRLPVTCCVPVDVPVELADDVSPDGPAMQDAKRQLRSVLDRRQTWEKE
jgi:hypothetical protein